MLRKGDEEMRQFVRFRIMIQCSPAAPPQLLNLLYWRLYLHHIIVCASLGGSFA
jgi:hypothetical protein